MASDTEPLFRTANLSQLQYTQGEIYDTCNINGERFALIVDRSLRALTNKSDGNIALNLPNYHIVILDPVSAPTLTLEGKSVTFITKLNIAVDLNVKVPKSTGNIIFYGEAGKVGHNANLTGKNLIQKGWRIETNHVEENGHVKEEKVDYLAMVKDLFKKGIANRSSTTIALAIFKAGHEILYSEEKEISRADIFGLWGIPL